MSADYRILMKHTEWLVYIRRNFFLVHACINWCSQMFIRLKHLNGGRYLTTKKHKVVPIVEYKPTYFSYVKLFDCKLMLIL